MPAREMQTMRMRSAFWYVFLVTVTGLALQAAEKNKLGLPNPDKPDIPYLIHANALVETEKAVATEQTPKNLLIYQVPGASSEVKTPLAGPEFLVAAENLDPYRLQLYRFESKNGVREILMRKKKKVLARPVILTVFEVERGLYRVRVDESLKLGEYCLTPEGSNDVFCFAVY